MSENIEKAENQEKEQEKKQSAFKEILDFCLPIIIALVLAILLKSFVFANAIVPTGSMLNTIQLKDRVIASRLTYVFNDPERYDIIIFEYPDYNPDVNPEEKYFVKRIIGLPGETIDILDGEVYVTDKDGKTEKLRDDFVDEENKDLYNGSFQVPEDSYFVMGDNRAHSVDSRYWISTNYVSRDKILGKVKFRYYPFNTMGKLE
ncbi:MAG: signal peptidase I [Eubacterium sp.]